MFSRSSSGVPETRLLPKVSQLWERQPPAPTGAGVAPAGEEQTKRLHSMWFNRKVTEGGSDRKE